MLGLESVGEDSSMRLTFRCRWRVAGSIGHWGHIHSRANEHVARVTVAPLGGKVEDYGHRDAGMNSPSKPATRRMSLAGRSRMIQIRDLRFRYHRGEFCLRVDDLSIPAGDRVSWTGPSGSGKTTLLHLLAGIVCPNQGHVTTCSVDLSRLTDSERRDFRITRLGLVFQDFALLEYLSVLDNMLLPYRINRSLRLNSSARDRAHKLADDVGLKNLLQRRPRELSQGERQRVAVCRALIANPDLVLADEPTANLDPENATRVLDALDRHAREKGATLIVVTHDRSVVPRFDRTIDISSLCGAAEAADKESSIHDR